MRQVKEFYKETPFNFANQIDFYIQNLLESNQIIEYKDLHRLLSRKKNIFGRPEVSEVIEFGCGTGWLTNSMSYYYNKIVKSIDFTEKAVETAKKVAKKLKVSPVYEVSDIFDYEDSRKYDLVISMGVLHHTYDCKNAFKKISTFVKPGGYLYVGLYHLYSRRPMLQLLQGHARWYGEKSAYNLFKIMNKDMKNSDHSYSWFRDQVIHPHETQHTIIEVSSWLKDIGFELVSTSINNYKSLKNTNIKLLHQIEISLQRNSITKNFQNLEFLPGYFTIAAKQAKDL